MSICFEAKLSKIENHTIVKIPISSSQQLPSRGMVMIQGTINNKSFKAPLEPDGIGSHWLELTDILMADTGLNIGQTAVFEIEPTDEWTEPIIPDDIMDAIMREGNIDHWNSLTTKARWEWLRWIRSTKNSQTRQKRINVACDKLQKGDKRPCCFDASRCTIPEVSKSGVLF